MPGKPARILCVGKEVDFLRIRCEVLTREGYEAKAVDIRDAEGILRREQFDLVILSVLLSDQDRSDIQSVIQDRMPILQLENVTFPQELLSKVEKRLTQTREIA